MRAPQLLQVHDGDRQEVLLWWTRPEYICPMHALPVVQDGGVLRIEWHERIAELGEAQTAIAIPIVALEE